MGAPFAPKMVNPVKFTFPSTSEFEAAFAMRRGAAAKAEMEASKSMSVPKVNGVEKLKGAFKRPGV